MRIKLFTGAVLLLALLFLTACREDPSYPLEPSIEFVSLTKIQNNTGVDQKADLKISFIDGDGDIGLTDEDTLAPFNIGSLYYYNCIVTMYEKQHGQFVEVIMPLPLNYRIPLTPPAIEGKALVGEVDVELYINNPSSPYDTVRFDVFIIDRALNHSNTITTPELVVDKH